VKDELINSQTDRQTDRQTHTGTTRLFNAFNVCRRRRHKIKLRLEEIRKDSRKGKVIMAGDAPVMHSMVKRICDGGKFQQLIDNHYISRLLCY